MIKQHLRTDLLDHGFVRYVDSMGSDLTIVRAARVSYDAAWRAGQDQASDERLLRRLWSGGKKGPLGVLPRHSSPFEAVVVTFEIMAPIFVFRQWHRHRTQAYNELSGRYRELPEVFYVPDPAVVGVQDTVNKQARVLVGGRVSSDLHAQRVMEVEDYKQGCQEQFARYRRLLTAGWPRELARCCLPFSTYSHMFATASLLNWLRFLSLRSDPEAQYEIRVYSDAIGAQLTHVAPFTMALWQEAFAK